MAAVGVRAREAGLAERSDDVSLTTQREEILSQRQFSLLAPALSAQAFQDLRPSDRDQILLQRDQLLRASASTTSGDFCKLDAMDADADSRSASMSPNVESFESRRQLHLACEQIRRRTIKDGLEELKACLPQSDNQKFTKAAVIGRAVNLIHSLQRQKEKLQAETMRLRAELSQARSQCSCSGSDAFDSDSTPHDHSPPAGTDYPQIRPKAPAASPQQQQQQQQPARRPLEPALPDNISFATSRPFPPYGQAAQPAQPPHGQPASHPLSQSALHAQAAMLIQQLLIPDVIPPGLDGLPFLIDQLNRRTPWLDPRSSAALWNMQSSLLMQQRAGVDDEDAYASSIGSIGSSDTAILDGVQNYDELQDDFADTSI